MRAKTNTLATSVRRALLLGLSGSAAIWAPAHAADEAAAPDKKDTKTLAPMTVTGSRVRRVETETASPVFTIDTQTIERTGKVTIGDLLQETPAIAGAATNPQVNNGGGDGAARVSLRGLGEVRTLLLLDGRRVAYDDVNSIPVAMVERIEILKDGASAIYGSDAIGGVVNFILKKDFTGAAATLNYGISDHEDGQRQGGSFTWGAADDRGNIMVNFNYNKQNEVRAADRKFSFFALTLYSGSVIQGGSSRTTTGRYAIPRSLAAANGINCSGTSATVAVTRIADRPGTAISDFRCFSNADLFNYQAVGNLELTPQERAGLFVKGSYKINDNVEFYAQAHTQNTRSKQQIAPLPFDGRPGNDEVVLSANSIYNPFHVDITDSRLRLSRIGNRSYDYRTDYKEVTGGLKGVFGETSWSWDVNYTWGKLEQDATTTGYLVSSKLAAALGPSFRDANGVARCGTPSAPIAGCTPLDFFGAPPAPGTASGTEQLAALALISPNTTNRTSSKFENLQGTVTGDLFELPAGMVGVAGGFEYRKQYLRFTPDFLANINPSFTCEISSEACTSATNGDITTKELYAEAVVPIVKDAPFAKAITLTAGTRYSKYSSFGNTTNSKLGLEWRPIDDLLVRATAAEVFRAPRIGDLFSGQFNSSDGFTDPCNGYTGGHAQACQNVATDGSFRQTDSQLSAIHGGNQNLKPEEGHVYTWGVVYDPSWLENFSTTMDVWRVHLKNTIGTVGTQNILQQCFQNGTFCDQFSRDANGEIIRLFDPNANVGVTDTNGIDLGAKYFIDTDFGRFRASVDATYIAEFDVKVVLNGQQVGLTQANAGTYLSSANGGLGNYSRWRGLGNLIWTKGPWEAQWTSRYISSFKVGGLRPGDPSADAGFANVQIKRGATTYHNFEAGYTYEPWNTKVQIGIDNAFDKQPPILYQNNTLNGNTDERTFDTVGRYYWINLAVGF